MEDIENISLLGEDEVLLLNEIGSSSGDEEAKIVHKQETISIFWYSKKII